MVIDTTSGNYGTWHGFRTMHVWSKNNFLYIGNLGSFKIGRYDGENFRVVLSYNSSPIFDIEQYGECLYVGGSHGLVYRTSDGSTWGAVFGNCGNDLSQMDVFALKEFQNKLYLGLAPGRWGWEATAQLHSYDGQIYDYWQLTQLVWSKQVSSDYEGVISLAKNRERLFIGTGKAAGYYKGSGTGEVYAYDGNEIELISGRMGYGIQALLYVPPKLNFDTIAPTSSVNPVAPYWRTLLPFTVTAIASDDLSWVENVELFYRYSSDNVNWGQWISFGVDTAPPWKFSFAAPEGDGYYEFYSIAIDEAGNIERPPSEADARAGVDTRDPESSVDPITPYWQNAEVLPFKVTATTSDALSGVESVTLRYRYSSDNLAWGPWTTFAVDGQEPWEWLFTASEGDGYYEFYSIARDRATNVEAVLYAGTDYTKTVMPYEWVPRASTTSVATGDDIGTWYTLPWAFPFWGEPKSRVYISSNGFLIFDPTSATDDWVNSLNGLRARWEIAPFWDDLRTDSAGGIVSTPGVYVDGYSNKIVITWEATRYGGRADSIKFQAVLFRNGDIQLSIAEATNLRRFSPTLGISKGDGINYIDITGERATCKTWKFTMPAAAADVWCGIDTAPPVSSVSPIEPYWRDSTTITLTATATDALSGVASISLYYRHSADNSTFTGWNKVATDTAAPWEWTLDLTENIYYEFYSVVRDVAGNVETPPRAKDFTHIDGDQYYAVQRAEGLPVPEETSLTITRNENGYIVIEGSGIIVVEGHYIVAKADMINLEGK
ncbi:MAG: Ig-like domain-containing protein, partial [Desulfitobacteriaceae bacterium]|nr:Ig-like domain-containing protein [Desulfitobacteriaceae bacterium]